MLFILTQDKYVSLHLLTVNNVSFDLERKKKEHTLDFLNQNQLIFLYKKTLHQGSIPITNKNLIFMVEIGIIPGPARSHKYNQKRPPSIELVCRS